MFLKCPTWSRVHSGQAMHAADAPKGSKLRDQFPRTVWISLLGKSPMRTLLPMTVMVLLAAGVRLGMGADDTKDAAIKKEKKNLVGTWKLVSCEAEGEKVPEKILKAEVVRWRITESTVISTVDSEVKGEDKYTLDPTTSPKAIDLTDKEGRRTPGIYLLEGHKLKDCLNERGKDRPKEFASKPESHLSVWVFKREKR